MLSSVFQILFLKIEAGREWTDLAAEMAQDPIYFCQKHMLWIIGFFILMFLVSRLNNRLEEQSVDHAIVFSRGLISTITAFIITPVLLVLIIDLFALVYHFPLIPFWRIWDWIQLTFTTYWWVAQCAFNSANLKYMDPLYDGNSLIRLIWVSFPIIFIWMRMAKTPPWKAAVIPVLMVLFFITRHKVAEDTFLTAGLEKHYPAWFYRGPQYTISDTAQIAKLKQSDDEKFSLKKKPLSMRTDEVTKSVKEYYKNNSGKMSFMIVGVLALSLIVGYGMKKPGIGAIIGISGIAILYLVMPASTMQKSLTGESVADRRNYREDLLVRFLFLNDSTKRKGCIEMTEIADELVSLYKKDKVPFPDSLCNRYKDYFHEFCKTSINH